MSSAFTCWVFRDPGSSHKSTLTRLNFLENWSLISPQAVFPLTLGIGTACQIPVLNLCQNFPNQKKPRPLIPSGQISKTEVHLQCFRCHMGGSPGPDYRALQKQGNLPLAQQLTPLPVSALGDRPQQGAKRYRCRPDCLLPKAGAQACFPHCWTLPIWEYQQVIPLDCRPPWPIVEWHILAFLRN